MGRGRFESEDLVGPGEGDAALLGSLEVPFQNQVGLVNFLQGSGFFADGGGEGVESGGASLKFPRQRLKKAFVHFVQAVLIDFEHFQGGDSSDGGGGALGACQGIIPDPAEKIVGDPRGASATAGDFRRGVVLQFDVEKPGGAADDGGEILGRVVVEPVRDAETGAERGAEESGAGGGSDQGETWEIEADGSGRGPLVDDDINAEILDSGVQVFLDDF